MIHINSISISLKTLFLGTGLTALLVWLSACASSNLPPEVAVTPIVIPTTAAVAQVEQPVTAGYDGEEALAAIPTPTHAVPTPVLEDIPSGQALAIAYAEDIDMTWELADPDAVDFGEEPVKIVFNDFLLNYDPLSTEAPELSPMLKALDGKMVELEGYMAPPLKLGLDWFQLTALPVGSCAFCSGASQWTPDIALVYVEGADDGAEMLFTWAPLRVVGELHIGENVDIETGMVSLVRIYTDADGMEELTFSQ